MLRFRSARRLRKPSPFFDMMESGAWTLRSLEEQAGLGHLVRGTLAIILACALVPPFLCSYILVSVSRVLWHRLLERWFKDIVVDSHPSVRAATDTRRNQGLVTLLLHVKGKCDVGFIRRKIQERILSRIGADGKPQFPRLKSVLTSRLGHYAWRNCPNTEFSLESHVVAFTQSQRGGVLTDANIQDYVTELVSKCLPVEVPPWQVVLIPLAQRSMQPHFYALVRLHHLLVDEVNAIHTLLRGDWGWGSPVLTRPRAIPYLVRVVEGSARSYWLQKRHEYDPALNPSSLRNPTVTALTITLIFLVVDAFKSISKKGTWRLLFLHFWIRALREQTERRQLGIWCLCCHIRRALSPLSLITEGIQCVWTMCLITFYCIPSFFLRASKNPSARILAKEAFTEFTFWTRVALDGPRLVFGELFRSFSSEPPPIRSLCGRRAVVWSDPAPIDLVERIASESGATPVEVLLSAACGALHEHYRRQGCVTLTVPVQDLGASGVLLLSPTSPQDDEPLASLRSVSAKIAAVRHQPALLLASAWLRTYLTQILPSLTVRLLLNCVTRRYSATIMTVSPDVMRDGPITIWGHTVDNILIWRPPQANISISLSLVKLGSTVRLAVMADQELWPHPAALPTAFLSQLRACSSALGVSSPRPVPIVPTVSETTAAGPSSENIVRQPSSELLRKEEERLVD